MHIGRCHYRSGVLSHKEEDLESGKPKKYCCFASLTLYNSLLEFYTKVRGHFDFPNLGIRIKIKND